MSTPCDTPAQDDRVDLPHSRHQPSEAVLKVVHLPSLQGKSRANAYEALARLKQRAAQSEEAAAVLAKVQQRAASALETVPDQRGCGSPASFPGQV